MKIYALLLSILVSHSTFVLAQQALPMEAPHNAQDPQQSTFMEELDPFDPQAEDILKAFDQYYETETGESSHLEPSLFSTVALGSGCRRASCGLWADVVRNEQRLYLYEQGKLIATWKVSTGIAGRGTPNFDKRPDGRIYRAYTSGKFPGGDYNGLGNMPYAVFIQGGFAIHGTPASNWGRLGTRASHGCIRVHPDNAASFNALVRSYGVANTWITVEEYRSQADITLGAN